MDALLPVVPARPAHQVSPLKALAGVLLLLPFVLAPLVALWYAGPDVLTEHATVGRYRETPAVVLGTGVDRIAAAGVTGYVPRVRFRYVVDGKTYLAERLTPRDASGTQRWARQRAGDYQPGEKVTAYYDPQDPGQAYLQKHGAPALTATFFLPVPILAIVLLMAANARMRRMRLAESAGAEAPVGSTR